MRRVALAVLLVTAALAGCVDDGSPAEPEHVAEEPSWPDGLLLTYEVTADGQTAEETFIVVNGTQQGPQLWAWNLSRPNLTSAFLELNDGYNPRDPLWSGLFRFPVEAGDEHEATLGGTEANVTWSQVDHEGPLDASTDLEGVARAGGEEVGRFRLSAGNVTAFTYLSFETEDGSPQTWKLVGTDVREDWNGPPAWSKGNWWTYEGSFQSHEGRSTVVYTSDQPGRQTEQRVLDPVRFDDRYLMVPFQGWRTTDIAPQSGFVSAFLSQFWSWPLYEGQSWSGETSAPAEPSQYQAIVERNDRAPLPDGSVSVTYTVEAYIPDAEQPFAEYEYSPRAGHLVEWRMTEGGGGSPVLNFTLEDFGQTYHGEMEIPQRERLVEIPVTSGPTTVERSFEVAEDRAFVRIAPHSFAGHGQDVDPEFELEIRNPSGDVAVHRNETHFSDRRLDLSGQMDAEPGTWNLTVELGEDVSVRLDVEALWYQTETVDYR
jgi:hypothetical protein